MDKRAAGVYYQMRKTSSKYRDMTDDLNWRFKYGENPHTVTDFNNCHYGSQLGSRRPSTSKSQQQLS